MLQHNAHIPKHHLFVYRTCDKKKFELVKMYHFLNGTETEAIQCTDTSYQIQFTTS